MDLNATKHSINNISKIDGYDTYNTCTKYLLLIMETCYSIVLLNYLILRLTVTYNHFDVLRHNLSASYCQQRHLLWTLSQHNEFVVIIDANITDLTYNSEFNSLFVCLHELNKE